METNAQIRCRCVFQKHGSDTQAAFAELKDRLQILLKRRRDPWCFGRTEVTAIMDEIGYIYKLLNNKDMKDDLVPGNLEWADDKKDKVVFVPKETGDWLMYQPSCLGSIDPYPQIDYKNVTRRMIGLDSGLNITWFGNHMAFWLSITNAKNAIFSRRYEIKGKIIFGYSIRLRILSKDII